MFNITTKERDKSPEEKLALPERLAFPVESIKMDPTLFMGNSAYGTPDNRYMNVRTDTNDILCFTTNRYKNILNQEVADQMNEVILSNPDIDTTDMEVIDSTSNNCAQWRRRVKFPAMTIQPQVGDIVRYVLDTSTSYDLTWAFTSASAAERLECLNGMVGRDFSYKTYRRHTTNISIEKEGAKLSNGINAFYESEEMYKRWDSIGVEKEEAEALFTEIASYKVSGRDKVSQRTVDTLMLDWDRTSRNMGSTLWATYNVATAWATHHDTKRTGSKDNAEKLRNSKVAIMLNSNQWKVLEDGR